MCPKSLYFKLISFFDFNFKFNFNFKCPLENSCTIEAIWLSLNEENRKAKNENYLVITDNTLLLHLRVFFLNFSKENYFTI